MIEEETNQLFENKGIMLMDKEVELVLFYFRLRRKYHK